jgi:predicted ATPase
MQKRIGLPETVTEFLRVFTRENPTLLIIDDLHRESALALPILKQVLAETTPMRLLIVVAHESTQTIGVELPALAVSDLSREETELLATGFLQAGEIGPRLSRLLWERTSGRPLFIESVLRTLSDAKQIDQSGDSAELVASASIDLIPDDIRKLIISRIDRLDMETHKLLRTAAVFGEGFMAASLKEIGDVSSEADLERMLHELVQAEIVELRGSIYHFRHGIAQQALYESLPFMQRVKLHRAAAEYLGRQSDWELHPLIIAHHWVAAKNPMRAVEIVTTAAESAERRGDIEHAIELYTHALDMFPHEKDLQTQRERLLGNAHRG